MGEIDLSAPAELFVSSSRGYSRRPMQYRRFDTGAEAVRYAVEELSPELLRGTVLESGEERLEGDEIRRLYDDQVLRK
jgi:hypothetical protein